MNSSFQQIYEHGLALKGEEFADSILDVIKSIHGMQGHQTLTTCCVKTGKTQCLARSASGSQCSRNAKNGEFCGLHGNYEEPRRCGRCSTNKRVVFHRSKWEHHGRIDKPMPIHSSSTGEVMLKGPKRAKTSYLLYTQSKRSEVAAQNPDMSPQDMTRLLASMWGNLSKEDKAPFDEEARIEKDRYVSEREVWKERKRLVKKANKKNDKTKPKRKTTSYLVFNKQERPKVMNEFPNLSPQDVTRELGRRWSALGQEDKKKYQVIAGKDEMRFREEMRSWNFERSGSREKEYAGTKEPIVLEEEVVKLCIEPIELKKNTETEDFTDDESEEEIVYNADSDDDVF